MAELEGRVLDDVLELHHVVGRGLQRREAVVDLLLAARSDLVVGALDRQADLFEEAAHLVTHIRVLVGGGDGEVTALDGHLIAHVAALFDAAGVPVRLGGVDGEERVVRGDLVAHVVEEVELRLGADEAFVCDTGRTQVGLGLRSHLARVARERLIREGVDDREVNDQGLTIAERVNERGRDVRDELHVGLVDRGKAAHR